MNNLLKELRETMEKAGMGYANFVVWDLIRKYENDTARTMDS